MFPYSVRIRGSIGVNGWVPPEISRAKPYPVPEVIDLPEGGPRNHLHKGTQPYSV
jgi:hypothetical protein